MAVVGVGGFVGVAWPPSFAGWVLLAIRLMLVVLGSVTLGVLNNAANAAAGIGTEPAWYTRGVATSSLVLALLLAVMELVGNARPWFAYKLAPYQFAVGVGATLVWAISLVYIASEVDEHSWREGDAEKDSRRVLTTAAVCAAGSALAWLGSIACIASYLCKSEDKARSNEYEMAALVEEDVVGEEARASGRTGRTGPGNGKAAARDPGPRLGGGRAAGSALLSEYPDDNDEDEDEDEDDLVFGVRGGTRLLNGSRI